MAFSGPVPFLPTGQPNYKSAGVVKVPYAKPRQIGLTGLFLPTYAIDPRRGARLGCSLTSSSRGSRSTAFVSKPGDDAMTTGAAELRLRPGHEPAGAAQGCRRSAACGCSSRRARPPPLPGGAGTVAFEGVRRYAAFDVRYDPTKPWVLGAAVLALAGLTRLPVRPPPAGLVQREHRRRRPYRGRGRGAVPRGRPAAGRRGAVAARGGRAAGRRRTKGIADGTTKGMRTARRRAPRTATTRGIMQGSTVPGSTVPGATVQDIQQGEE